MGAPKGNKNAAGKHTGMSKRRKKEEKARVSIRKNTSKKNKKRILKSWF